MTKQKTDFRPSGRPERIASAVQKHIAEILRDNYAEDPVLSRVSVVGAESSGVQFIRIFYYVRAGGMDGQKIQTRLDFATPAIRRELAHRMNQKYVPDIRFDYDDTLEKSARIDELLANIEKEQK